MPPKRLISTGLLVTITFFKVSLQMTATFFFLSQRTRRHRVVATCPSTSSLSGNHPDAVVAQQIGHGPTAYGHIELPARSHRTSCSIGRQTGARPTLLQLRFDGDCCNDIAERDADGGEIRVHQGDEATKVTPATSMSCATGHIRNS